MVGTTPNLIYDIRSHWYDDELAVSSRDLLNSIMFTQHPAVILQSMQHNIDYAQLNRLAVTEAIERDVS